MKEVKCRQYSVKPTLDLSRFPQVEGYDFDKGLDFESLLKSYANTLYWNETLRADSYKSKLDMTALKDRYGLELEPLDKFGPDELEARHKLLYKLVGIIWS